MSRIFKKFYTLQTRGLSNVVYIIQYCLKWSFIEYGEEINARDRPICIWLLACVRLWLFFFLFFFNVLLHETCECSS